VTLAEGSITGVFTGEIPTGTGGAAHDGVLQTSDGETITATYIDADDGLGGVNVVKTDTAVTDCTPPVFAGLTSMTPLDNEVELTWDPATDADPVAYRVYRSDVSGGQDFGNPDYVTEGSPFVDPFAPNGIEWFYVVRAVDPYGNEDDNTVEFSGTPVGPDRLFWDDFDTDGLAQWTIINGGTNDVTWTDDNLLGRVSDYWSGLFAIADKESIGDFQTMNEQLITPPIDCSMHEGIKIGFSHVFEKAIIEVADVDLSYDSVNWVQVRRFWIDQEGEVELDVPAADLHQQVYFRFHYFNAGLAAEYWGIDNVEVTGWPSTAPTVTTTTSTTTTTVPADDDTADDDTTDDDTTDDDDTADDDTSTDDDTADDDVMSGEASAGDDDDDSGSCCGC